jgi:hypothetical protein
VPNRWLVIRSRVNTTSAKRGENGLSKATTSTLTAQDSCRGARTSRGALVNERDSSRVSGVGPIGDRVVQRGQSFGFAHLNLAPRPHAAQVVPTWIKAKATRPSQRALGSQYAMGCSPGSRTSEKHERFLTSSHAA